MRNYLNCTNDKALNEVVETLTTIDPQAIENKLANATPTHDIDLLLQANDKDFAPLLKRACNKTGRELQSIPLDDLKRVININGREKALEILRIQACQTYAAEWLHTDPDSLNKLMINDCSGYFVYAVSRLFHADFVIHSNASKTAPLTGKGDSTETGLLDNFMADFPVQDRPEELEFYSMPAPAAQRYKNLQDKIFSRKNLESFHSDDKITEANELLRKFLGLCQPEQAVKMSFFSCQNLYEITEDFASLNLFIQELKDGIKSLFTNYFKGMHHTKVTYILSQLNRASITASDIATIKAKFKGLSNFHSQPKIRSLSRKESIQHDLLNFWDDNVERDPTLQRFFGTNKDKDQFNALVDKVNSYTVKDTTKPFVLKLGS